MKQKKKLKSLSNSELYLENFSKIEWNNWESIQMKIDTSSKYSLIDNKYTLE